MSTTIIVRGTKVTFRSLFFDEDGVGINPASASIYIRYPQGSSYVSVPAMSMTQAGLTWSVSWESAVSQSGKVAWSVRTSTPSIAEDGFITLTANPANPEP